MHLHQKEFECEMCHRKFAHKQYLKEHMNTHTKIEPYVCDQKGCNMSFKQRSILSLHRKNVHMIIPYLPSESKSFMQETEYVYPS